ncbi:MAG: hypothetical protein ABF313_16280, partial [Marivita sp.]
APMSMGYVPADLSAEGTVIWGEVRGKRLPCRIIILECRQRQAKWSGMITNLTGMNINDNAGSKRAE